MVDVFYMDIVVVPWIIIIFFMSQLGTSNRPLLDSPIEFTWFEFGKVWLCWCVLCMDSLHYNTLLLRAHTVPLVC